MKPSRMIVKSINDLEKHEFKRKGGGEGSLRRNRRERKELNEKEIYTRAQNPLEYLLKSNYCKLSLQIPSDSSQITIGLLRNSAYQRLVIYNSNSTISLDRQRFQVMRVQNTRRILGDDAHFHDVFPALLRRVNNDCKEIFQYVHCLPGFDTLHPLDFATLLKENFMCLHGLLISELYAEKECYSLVVDGITFTRKWHEHWVGKETSDLMFEFEEAINRLKLTQSELSLIIPYLLSLFDTKNNNLLYPEKAQKLHDLYKNAMLKEFQLGKRDQEFMISLAKCFSVLAECGKSLRNKSLIPESLQKKQSESIVQENSDVISSNSLPS